MCTATAELLCAACIEPINAERAKAEDAERELKAAKSREAKASAKAEARRAVEQGHVLEKAAFRTMAEEISEEIASIGYVQEPYPGKPITRKIAVPKHQHPSINFHKRLIGYKGEVIKPLAAASRCKISVFNLTNHQPDPYVLIEGWSIADVEYAVRLVTPLLSPNAKSTADVPNRAIDFVEDEEYTNIEFGALDSPTEDSAMTTDQGSQNAPSNTQQAMIFKPKLTAQNAQQAPPLKAGNLPPRLSPKSLVPTEFEECAICLDPLNEGSTSTLDCCHRYHSKCLRQMQDFHKSVVAVCPQCDGAGSPRKQPLPGPELPILHLGASEETYKSDESDDDGGWQRANSKSARESSRSVSGGGRGGKGNCGRGSGGGANLPVAHSPAPTPLVDAPARDQRGAASLVLQDHLKAEAEESDVYSQREPLRIPKDTDPVKALAAAGGNIIVMLQDALGLVGAASIALLVKHGLTSLLAIMKAHDDGMAGINIKKGTRIRILRLVGAITLPGEDEKVKQILESHNFGKCRYRCVEEQIDLEALCYFGDESDEVLLEDFGLKEDDIQAFRSMLARAKELKHEAS